MIDVFERLQYTCISTIHFLRLELQEDIVQFCIVLGKHKHCSGGAGGFHCVDRYSDSNGGIRDGIPSMYINRKTPFGREAGSGMPSSRPLPAKQALRL